VQEILAAAIARAQVVLVAEQAQCPRIAVVAQTASEIAVSHPAPGSDRVATHLVVVGLGGIPRAPPAVAEVRAWEAVDSAVAVAVVVVSMAEGAVVVAAVAVAEEEAGGKRNVDREKNDKIKIKHSDFAEGYGDLFRDRCC
jgi:hypothetical protein